MKKCLLILLPLFFLTACSSISDEWNSKVTHDEALTYQAIPFPISLYLYFPLEVCAHQTDLSSLLPASSVTPYHMTYLKDNPGSSEGTSYVIDYTQDHPHCELTLTPVQVGHYKTGLFPVKAPNFDVNALFAQFLQSHITVEFQLSSPLSPATLDDSFVTRAGMSQNQVSRAFNNRPHVMTVAIEKTKNGSLVSVTSPLYPVMTGTNEYDFTPEYNEIQGWLMSVMY